jgi:DNA-directed RNA polymerase subunit RPC12/RpoP
MADPTGDARRWATAVAAMEFRSRDLAECVLGGGTSRENAIRCLELKAITTPEDARRRLEEWFGFPGPCELAEIIAYAGMAAVANLLDEAAAWHFVMRAARQTQGAFRSWRDFGDAYADEFLQITDGRGRCDREIREILAAANSPWSQPWDVDLGDRLPLRQRWALAIAAPITAGYRDDLTVLGGLHGARFARIATERLQRVFTLAARADVIAFARPRLHAPTARGLAEVVAAVGWATVAGHMTEEDAWHVTLLAAKLAQRTHASWAAFGAAFSGDGERALVDELCATVWSKLPWTTELDVQIFDPAAAQRVLQSTCGECGAPRTRPSATAYVYCDHCGHLVDYDFGRACELPIAAPGPAYETLRGELAPALADARARDDIAAYRDLQRRLFDAFVDAAPLAVPIRAKDPEYRARYVAWLAEAETVAAFDADATARKTALDAAVAKLAFARIDGHIRVAPEPYRAMLDAMFAHEARRDELAAEHGIYALHPDGASRELQRHIGLSLFAQGWLAYLDEADARALLERAGLTRAYTLVAQTPETRSCPCSRCGATLDVLRDARRVVCDHCGRLADVIGSP